jgi:asparagine synthase (glutamine-hydrolysing)
MSLDFKLRRALRGLSYPPECWNPAWLGPLEPAEILDLMHERVTAEDLYSEAIAAWRGAPSADPVDRTLEFYTRFYLQDDILAKVDRASMMHSLEVRAPFLDNDLVEFARRLPSRYKMRDGQRKYLLKMALKPLLPAGIIHRPKKGFGIPLADWMRLLPAPSGQRIPFIAQDAWKQRWEAHVSGHADNRQLLWCGHALQHHFQQAN